MTYALSGYGFVHFRGDSFALLSGLNHKDFCHNSLVVEGVGEVLGQKSVICEERGVIGEMAENEIILPLNPLHNGVEVSPVLT